VAVTAARGGPGLRVRCPRLKETPEHAEPLPRPAAELEQLACYYDSRDRFWPPPARDRLARLKLIEPHGLEQLAVTIDLPDPYQS
jgi:hypothetical protein